MQTTKSTSTVSYKDIPEYLESHHALVLDQPDTFRDFDEYTEN